MISKLSEIYKRIFPAGNKDIYSIGALADYVTTEPQEEYLAEIGHKDTLEKCKLTEEYLKLKNYIEKGEVLTLLIEESRNSENLLVSYPKDNLKRNITIVAPVGVWH